MEPFSIQPATHEDLPKVVSLMNAGAAGARVGAESDDLAPYLEAFAAIKSHPDTEIYVARTQSGEVIGSFELSFIHGLSFQGRPRAQIESAHVRADLRSQGIGAVMMNFAVEKAVERGCSLVQLTSNKTRADAHRFYERLNFAPTHDGFKLILDAPAQTGTL